MKLINTVFGLLFITAISCAAFYLGKIFPLIGAPVIAITAGIIIKSTIKTPQFIDRGSAFASRRILQLSIIAMGATLNLSDIASTGVSSLAIMVFTVFSAFAAAFVAGRLLGVRGDLRNLIGVGTAICGGSAIAAVSSVTKPDEHDISYSLSAIFLFNIVAVLVFPYIGYFLHLSQEGFGLFAGIAINDTSSVVAAGYIYGNKAGDLATIVKLTRTLLIIPISIIFSLRYHGKNSKAGARINFFRIIPFFIIGFLAASALNSAGLIPEGIIPAIRWLSKFMIIMALCGVGLRTDLKKIIGAGFKPILLGLIVWLTVILTSLAAQFITGQI